jgi:hypothetical protein
MKFHSGSKLHFSYFLVPNLRDKKTSGQILMVKREYWLRQIPTTKTGYFDVNSFFFFLETKTQIQFQSKIQKLTRIHCQSNKNLKPNPKSPNRI